MIMMKEQDYFELGILEKRLQTFKKWPFKAPNKCTKEKMAEAGFYFAGNKKEPDLACCFVCLKELDGWGKNDDPWEEHKAHSPNCQFILLNKSENELTYGDMRKLEEQRSIIRMTKALDDVIKNFDIKAAETRAILEKM